MITMTNHLKDADRLETDRGTMYTGPSPFFFNKRNQDDMDRIMDRPWVIDHPDAAGKLWRAKGVETFCLMSIKEGFGIGLLVTEWINT